MKKIFLSTALTLALCGIVSAQSETLDFSRYKKTASFKVEGITTPKVVRYKSLEPLGSGVILVEERSDNLYTEKDIVHYRVLKSYEKIRNIPNASVVSVSSSFEGNERFMLDDNENTYMTFDSREKKHSIEVAFDQKTDVSGIYIVHDTGIISPQTVSVEGLFSDGEWRPILSRKPYSWHISWPKVWVNRLRFTFETPHFFRINEMKFLGQEASQTYDELIFYAQEGKTYRVYFEPSFGQKYYHKGDYLPLNIDDRTPEFDLEDIQKNPSFDSDFDNDGIDDLNDLCPKISDASNADTDKNGKGDVCEDPDQDGKISSKDNCPFEYNPGQQDIDQDGIGDKCDDLEGRVTENVDYLLYLVFGGVVILLGFLLWRGMKKD